MHHDTQIVIIKLFTVALILIFPTPTISVTNIEL